ncbi:unnamed protein product [Knipowitschia caucasica]|uniref:Immunoglobulin V-set domain-containing protein n=1 Tax=Knipowitschia caucasica TaxID=637954 RepID=A0AAV2MIX0_KNICA
MLRVLSILVLFPELIYGFLRPSDTMCKFLDTDSTCSVTHGGDLYLQVMANASDHRLELFRGSKKVLIIRRETVKILEEAFRNRTEAFRNNGTIKIQNVQWEDAGKYKVDVYDKDGIHLKKVEVMLEVKANPWPVVVYAGASVGAFLLVVLVSVCIYRKSKAHKQPGAVI